MIIEKNWIDTDTQHLLNSADFYGNEEYRYLFNICVERIKTWVMCNKNLLTELKNSSFDHSPFSIRQMAYGDSKVSSYVRSIQTLGRKIYRAELYKRIAEILTEEYAKLPEFARQTYSLDDYVESYVVNFMRENKKKIGQLASAQVYGAMRNIINDALM